MKTLLFSILLFSVLFLISCSSVKYETIYPTLSDGRYDSEFPYRGCSEQLAEIGESLKRINSIAFYTTYVFSSDEKITIDTKEEEVFKKYSKDILNTSQSSSGTGLVINTQDGNLALLTCAHVVDFPDTLYSYFQEEDGSLLYLESISIKKKQSNYINHKPKGAELEIIAVDEKADIAVLYSKIEAEYAYTYLPFGYPDGKAKELEWGSFVYVYGFPMNYKMLSRAIVSSPNSDDRGAFLIDAVFNRGFSGGVVLAVRDGVPNFELVGIVKSVPAEKELILKPKELTGNYRYSPDVPYSGEMYVQTELSMKYGITRIIPVEAIEEFLKENSDKLLKKGIILENTYN